MEDIILLGLGGHAHSVVDSIEQAGQYHIVGFLDTEEMQGRYFRNYGVLDTDAALEKYYAHGIRNAFITIGFLGRGNVRNRLYQQLKKIGYTVPNIIDNSAIIALDVRLEDGIFIGKKAVVNANAHIQKMCIVNTGAIIEHDCHVGEFSHMAVSSVLCGDVSVGKETFIGANATVIQGRKIGSNCIVGAGTTIRKNIENGEVIR